MSNSSTLTLVLLPPWRAYSILFICNLLYLFIHLVICVVVVLGCNLVFYSFTNELVF